MHPIQPQEAGTDDVLGELPPVSIEDRDLSVQDIVARAERADDHLRKWRSESVERRAQWEAEEAVRLQEEAAKRGTFYLGGAVGLLGMVCLTAVGLWLGGAWEAAPQQVVEAATVEAAPVEVAPVEVAPMVVEAAPVDDAVVEEAPLDDAVAEAVAVEEPVAEPAVAEVGPTLGEASVWSSGAFAWTEAVVAESGVQLAWFDASGAEALDRVACDGVVRAGFKCYSGRSARRIGYALDAGAAPGTWTVKACQGADCTAVGTFEVPLR